MKEEKIIMHDSEEAAQPVTITLWKSSTGRLYDDERSARYDGSTHVDCKTCGEPAEKPYTLCDKCKAKAELERYLAMPSAEWDGVSMIYSDTRDQYYASPDEAYDEIEEGGDLSELRLIICEPNYVRPLEGEYCCDEMSEDGDLPNAVEEAMDVFNKSVDGIILSWSPSKVALKVPE
jgi:hypothetical protein